MKVIFGGETKRIPEIKEFNELINYAADIFNANQLKSRNDLKLFYEDEEGDIISVTCQSDLEEAYRSMTGRIKFAFATTEEQARQSLCKGQPTQSVANDSFFRSEYVRPNTQQSILNRSSFSQYNHSDLGPNPMNSQNMMGLMFEAYLQNQIEGMIRNRTMQGQSMLGMNGMQANHGPLPVEGGQPLEDIQPIQEQPIADDTQDNENKEVNDTESDQNIDEIVRSLDEANATSGAEAALHETEEVPEVNTDTMESATTTALPVPRKKSCGCAIDDLCFKCILGKVSEVFSLEPFFEANPTYQAICIDYQREFIGIAGADFSAMFTFKNSGNIGWPTNVQLKLVNGTIVLYNALGLENQCVQPGEELNVSLELKLPVTPGNYLLNFRLVHGDNIEFGDEVTVNLVANTSTGQVRSAQAIEEPKLQEVMIEQPLTETNGDTIRVDQEKDVDGSGDPGQSVDDNDENEEIDDLDLSANSWQMVQDEEEGAAAEPPGSTTESRDCCPKTCTTCAGPVSERAGSCCQGCCDERQEDIAPSTPRIEVCTRDKEVQRNSYNKQVYMTRYDNRYQDNLVALMQVGCLDFDANLRTLQRTNNQFDLAVAELIHEVE